jgi:hypothetical protein
MMVQILPNNSRRSFGEEILSGLNEAVPQLKQYFDKRNTSKALQNLTGQDLSNLDPEMQKAFLVAHLQGKNEEKKQQMKQQQKDQFYKMLGLNTDQASESQSQGNDFAQTFQNPMNPEESQSEQNMGRPMTQPREQKPKNVQSWYNGLNDQQRTLLALENPAAANALENARKFQQTQDLAERKHAQREAQFEEEKRKSSPEYKREQSLTTAQAQADIKYNQALQEQERQGKLKTQSLENLERLNKKGVTGKPFEKLLEKGGLTALTSEGRREFAADVKNLITDIRSILGGQFSNFEFQTILNAYPSADFSQEANSAIIKNLKTFQDIKNKEVQFARDIKKENDGKVPPDFQSLVNERVNAYAQSRLGDIKDNTREIMNSEYGIEPGFVLMFDKQGKPLRVPDNEVSQLLENDMADLP